jgi:hypothetical protein
MGGIWIFLFSLFAILFLIGYTLSTLEKNTIISNWGARRCGLPVMVAGRFFKPDTDPRTPSEFSSDNFDFCMKSYVDKFIAFFMAPINALFGKQVGIAGNAMGMMGTIRKIAQTMYNAFSSYLDTFYRKYVASIFQFKRIIDHLRMAVQRIGAIAMSMIFTGITLFRGLINTIQFIIKVILIVCAIMLVIIIILFFVLFPVIPIILAALTAVVYTTLGLSTIVGGSVADTVNNMKSGFCFSEGTLVLVKTNKGVIHVPVEKIKLGDELVHGEKITAVIVMEGQDETLYDIGGVYLSGSHLIKSNKGWHMVEKDERAIPTNKVSPTLYCFNTTSNCIPIYCPRTAEILLCRDWEEIANDDEKGQYIWNYMILSMLNKNSNYTSWKDAIHPSCNVALVTKETLVKVTTGFVPISTLKLSDTVVDHNGLPQTIKGVVTGILEDVLPIKGSYHVEMYEEKDGVWIKGASTIPHGSSIMEGMTLITETGEFIIWDEDEKKEKRVRDFTEIGYDSIHKTYSFIEARLRIPEYISKLY